MGKGFEDIPTQLSHAIAATLVRFAEDCDSRIAMVALDVHPWNGVLALGVLTQEEVESDPLLRDSAEIAAWRHFDLGQTYIAEWHFARSLGGFVKDAYSRSADRSEFVDAVLGACATAIQSSEVQRALQWFDLGDDFVLSVAHPDDGREFCGRY